MIFGSHVKTAYRGLVKHRSFSLINILGLTIGITVCLMIFLFILNEFSVDGFHAEKDRIYRITRGYENDGKHGSVSYLSGMYAPALLNDFKGEMLQAVRVNPSGNLVTVADKSFLELKIYNTDPDFFRLFSFPLIHGDANTVLRNPGSVVLTESTAKKYFGSVDATMGKVIVLDKNLPLTVTGIAKDVPSNSHLYFDLIVPLENYKTIGIMTTWINNGLYTYVKLAPGVTPQQVEAKLPAFMEKYLGTEMRKYSFHWSLSLTPLRDVYFDRSVFDDSRHGDRSVVYVFLSIAVLLLLIACINFMNLSTVRAVDRSKEVGLRKVVGALRGQLIWQFITEALLLTFFSCLLAVGLLQLLQPAFDRLLGYSLTVSWNTPPIYLFLAGVILVVGFLAGSYPAFVLSSWSPIQALRGKLRLGRGGAMFRQALVVVQFTISVILIVGTLVITRQMSFMKNKALGYDQEQTAVIRIDNDDFYNNLELFKSTLQARPEVQSVSFMSGEPGGFFDGQTFEVEGHPEIWHARTEYADFDYVRTLGLTLIAGRDFSAQFPTDSTASVLINRTAAAKLGWTPQQAVGRSIRNTVRDKEPRRIIGVVEDFNFLSLKEQMDALVISSSEDWRQVLVRLKPGRMEAGIGHIGKLYQQLVPAFPFNYRFLDKNFQELYQKDLRQQTILLIFAALAIFVACLGLFGLASFTATKRVKEIGVRKVLGASVRSIVLLLSRDLLKPVVLATLIALPVGYWTMDNWLRAFAYQAPLSAWIFILAATLSFGIALVTVGMKAVAAASANPVRSLKAE